MSKPTFIEIEEFRRAGSRKQWAAIGILGVSTILLGAVTLALALKPSPVIAFDAQGRPMIFTDTYSPAIEVSRVRVDWFFRYFLEKYITVDSTRLETDLTQALNLMAPDLREIVMLDGKEIERRKKYKDGNVRSHLADFEIRIGDFDPKNTDQKIYLYGWGRHVFEPIFGQVPEAEKANRFIFVKAALERHPVSPSIPHGLLVRYCEWYSFESRQDLDVQLLKLQREGK